MGNIKSWNSWVFHWQNGRGNKINIFIWRRTRQNRRLRMMSVLEFYLDKVIREVSCEIFEHKIEKWLRSFPGPGDGDYWHSRGSDCKGPMVGTRVAWQAPQEGQSKQMLLSQRGEIGKTKRSKRPQISPNSKTCSMRSKTWVQSSLAWCSALQV